MTICQIEELEAGRGYPRTCPTCLLTGVCAKRLDRKALMADRDTLTARVAELEAALQRIAALAMITDLLDDIEIHMAEVAKAALTKPGDAPKVPK